MRHPDMVPQADLEDEIRRLSALLDQATSKILYRAVRAGDADALYKREFTKAFLLVDGKNKEEREAKALMLEGEVNVFDLYDRRKRAEAVLMAAQEAARNLRAQLSALQTLAANQRFLLERTG